MCNYYYPSWPVWPSTTPSIPLPTTPYIPLPQSKGNDSSYFLLPSGQIIKDSILSVIPIKNNRWKIKFYDTNKTIILDKDDGLALRKMLVGIYGI